ncbi:AAA family ATPase [Pseudogulbenkiania sp. MAI-1]|uniref:AAA family ATPase n=1 Tax=Pseudogulbenkiania sp. MAI-1 TaxID=990370 RepID=UPI00045EA40F|nr:AAA family ATPase [Pseudogulbenkiania sp. MAI-1]
MKVSIISHNTKNLDELRRFVEADDSRDVQVFQGGAEMLAPVADQLHPDILILEMPDQEATDFSALSSLNIRHPDITLILLANIQTPEILLGAMRAGVREVLPSPVNREALHLAISRVEEKRSLQNAARPKGKVFAFIPCKGGSGSTFLSTNIAYSLATQENKNVILIDLNLQFGDAVLFISDHRPPTNLAEVARQMSRMDASFLDSSLLPVLPNLGVLAAPEDPVQAMEVNPNHIDTLINLARNHYDVIILDVGRALDPVSIKALDHADVVLPVLQITLPFIRDAKRLLDVLRSLGYSRDKIKLLVNRYEKGGDLRLDEVERTLGMSVFKTLPNSFKAVAASVNQGIPICKLTPNNPVTRGIQEVGSSLLQEGHTQGSWWGSLLQRIQGGGQPSYSSVTSSSFLPPSER